MNRRRQNLLRALENVIHHETNTVSPKLLQIGYIRTNIRIALFCECGVRLSCVCVCVRVSLPGPIAFSSSGFLLADTESNIHIFSPQIYYYLMTIHLFLCDSFELIPVENIFFISMLYCGRVQCRGRIKYFFFISASYFMNSKFK